MRKLILMMAAAALMALLAGCGVFSGDTESIKAAILEYAEGSGKEKAIGYLDQLVADGKLGSANAEKLKAALDDGIDKLKEELEKEESEE